MPSVQDLIFEVSWNLNDQESGFQYRRWPQNMLIRYLNDALLAVANARPELFSANLIVPLAIGQNEYTLNDEIVEVTRITKTSDGCQLSQGDYNTFAAFRGAACSGAKLRQYFYDPRNPKTIFFSPAAGEPTTVIINARVTPPFYTLANTGSEVPIRRYHEALKQYMRMKAHELDVESATSYNERAIALRNFNSMLEISEMVDRRQQSGYRLGQRGLGDPRVA